MKAAPADQLKLLDLQELDRKISGMKHQLNTLPAAAKAQDLKTQQEQLRGELALAVSAKKDLTRALKQAEAEVDKIQQRAKTQRERLDSGTLVPKEMEKIQEELALLAARQGDLEDEALDAMDAVERASEHLNELESKQEHVEEDLKKAKDLAESEIGNLQQKLDDLVDSHNTIVSDLPEELVEEYETAKKATGGIGVVEVNGVCSVGLDLEFSVAEISRLETAAPDDVITSEDHEVILVRR